MPPKKREFTPWSSLDNMLGKLPNWLPPEDRQRIQAYDKYDQMYWNDPTQYAIRVLEDEQPIYIPNARIVVDTTAQYLLKGICFNAIKAKGDRQAPVQRSWDAFLARERIMSKVHINKQAGVSRGDYAFHITANPDKEVGTRISVDTLHPGQVIPVYDDEDPDKLVKMHIVEQVKPKGAADPDKYYVRKLTYEAILVAGRRRIRREEAIWEMDPDWWGEQAKLYRTILKKELLPYQITQFPVYWFPNIEWEGQHFGSSELRGLEFLDWACSQGATDTQMALGLEGLGVYATDGGRPVNDVGVETDWEVAPGKVMEVPSGSYFRRVEGVGSVKPMQDHLNYLEEKMFAASGMTDVARGMVDVQVAQSGIALAIKFMPTLARIEPRDIAQKEIYQQMMFDLQFWFEAYEQGITMPEIEVAISSDKLPVNRVERVNELNNMFDRKIITREMYRKEMRELGYDIPANTDDEIIKEAEKFQSIVADPNNEGDEDPSSGNGPDTSADGGNNRNVDNSGNRSNNRNRPNESGGTESGQSLRRQARS